MNYRISIALMAVLIATTALVGCEKKETAGEPPIHIGMAPGELEPYEEQTLADTTTADTSTTTTGSEEAASPGDTETTGATTDDTATTAIPRMYTIHKGDTLFALARRFYSDERKWRDIWNANRDKIPNKDLLLIGTEIVLP